MRRTCVVTMMAACLLMSAAQRTAGAEEPRVQILQTPGKVRFGLLGEPGKSPAPTLFVMAVDIQVTLTNPEFNEVGRRLMPDGWLCAALDVSCHGEDARPGEPPGLTGWRARLERGDNFVQAHAKQVSEVLDFLIAEGKTDKTRVALAGTSRGGFMALHCAALDERFRAVAAFAPVTDLRKLREFSGTEQHPLISSVNLLHSADKLAGRAVWVCIGNNDERVSTDECIAFTRATARAAIARELPAEIEIHVMPSVGHRIHATAHDEAAAWFRQRVK